MHFEKYQSVFCILVLPEINDRNQIGRAYAGDDGSVGTLMASSLGRIGLGFLGIGVNEMNDYRLPPLQTTREGKLVQVRLHT